MLKIVNYLVFSALYLFCEVLLKLKSISITITRMQKVLKLIRLHLQNLKPYSSARDEFSGSEGTFLDANENPFGSVSGKPYNRYPDPHQREAKVKIAQLKGVQPEQIFLGNGSDEAIDLLIKLFCEPQKDSILIFPPTYGMYKVCADIQNVGVVEVPLTQNFQLDMSTISLKMTENIKLIWVCSPNNPSGNLLQNKDIVQLISKNPDKIVVVDEAYIDFAKEPSLISRLGEFENLIVIQTFSKAWGMAGLRIGAAYADKLIIEILDKIKYPYNLNQLTQQALIDALSFADVVPQYVAQLNDNKRWLIDELNKIDVVQHIYPSDSNQLLVRFERAHELFQNLINELIITRNRTNVVLCEDCIRISVGTREELALLIQGIKKVTSM